MSRDVIITRDVVMLRCVALKSEHHMHIDVQVTQGIEPIWGSIAYTTVTSVCESASRSGVNCHSAREIESYPYSVLNKCGRTLLIPHKIVIIRMRFWFGKARGNCSGTETSAATYNKAVTGCRYGHGFSCVRQKECVTTCDGASLQ